MASKEVKGQRLFRSTSIVAMMTMLSRIFGFVRDVIVAQIFGAGAAFDSYLIAFKLPNFLRRLFGEGAFSQAFVPVLAEFRTKRTEEETRDFIARIFGTLGLIVLVLVAVVELFVPVVIMLFAPGFFHDPVRFGLSSHMLHIMFPYLFFIVMTACSGAILNTFNRFAVPAFTPVLLNVALISAAWFLAPYFSTPIYALAWGALLGGIIQLGMQLPFLFRLGVLVKPKLGFRDEGVRRVMKLMVPALFGVSVAQISLLVDNLFASFLPVGSISWLYYSDRLTYLPLGVIGVALATVVLPNLSRHHASKNKKVFNHTLDWSLRIALIVGIPAALGLFTLAQPIIATLIQHGEFGARDVIMTAKSLMAFSIGLPGFMLIKILASGFYSQQNIKTPVKIAAIALVANLILNLALIFPMRHAGLALATSLAALLNASLLLFLLYKRKCYQPEKGWAAFVSRLVVASLVMFAVIHLVNRPLHFWLTAGTFVRAWYLAVVLVVSIIAYVVSLVIGGVRLQHLRPPREIV